LVRFDRVIEAVDWYDLIEL